MNEKTVKTEPAMPELQRENLSGLLQAASAHLRSGDDAEGIENMLAALSKLQELVENDQNSIKPQIDLSQLLPAVRAVYCLVQNQDIAGIADLIEDVLSPMAEGWMRGGDDT